MFIINRNAEVLKTEDLYGQVSKLHVETVCLKTFLKFESNIMCHLRVLNSPFRT